MQEPVSIQTKYSSRNSIHCHTLRLLHRPKNSIILALLVSKLPAWKPNTTEQRELSVHIVSVVGSTAARVSLAGSVMPGVGIRKEVL